MQKHFNLPLAYTEEELESLGQAGTWSRCNKPMHKQALSTKWVFTRKLVVSPTDVKESIRYKARLVVRGFEQKYGIDYLDTFAPVIAHKTIRMLLALSAANGYLIHQMDVKTAFLHGSIKEEIYMHPPPGFTTAELPCMNGKKPGRFLKLHKSLYGLKQAPLVWNTTISAFLRTLGFTQSQEDPGLYLRPDIILALYMDDMLLFSSSLDSINSVKEALSKEYQMSDLGEARRFLGMDIKRSSQTDSTPAPISISQERYITDILNRFGLLDCKPMQAPMANHTLEPAPEGFLQDAENTRIYQQMLGCLM
ncbi:MAG: reverse transcriptase domain-containing protein [Paenibacillus sp.]|uniref:reverse transcriptase domain-containing protein n=1 Tax=Paenibacillus sp. TaxID=58172 RepID=UPI003B811C12